MTDPRSLSAQTGVELKDRRRSREAPNLRHVLSGRGPRIPRIRRTRARRGAPLKVNSNVGSIADAVRTTDVRPTPATGPLIAWQDGRDGNPNVYTTGFQRFHGPAPDGPIHEPARALRCRCVRGRARRQALGLQHDARDPGGEPAVGRDRHSIRLHAVERRSTANPRTITVSADATYTASFATQYQITVDRTRGPDRHGERGPTDRAVRILVQRSRPGEPQWPRAPDGLPDEQYRFASGTTRGPDHAITCDRAKTITATFVLQYQVTIQTNPTGRDVVVAGITQTGPYVFWCDNASSVTIDAPESPGRGAPGPSTGTTRGATSAHRPTWSRARVR